VHETVSGKALDRAMEIAQRLSSYTPESVAYIKRLVRNATETPLAQGLALERNLFLNCASANPHSRACVPMKRAHTSPSRSIVVQARSASMTESGAHVRVIEKTPAYWRVVFDYPPFNIVDPAYSEAYRICSRE